MLPCSEAVFLMLARRTMFIFQRAILGPPRNDVGETRYNTRHLRIEAREKDLSEAARSSLLSILQAL